MPPAIIFMSELGCMVRVQMTVAPLTPRISYAHEFPTYCTRVPYYIMWLRFRLSCGSVGVADLTVSIHYTITWCSIVATLF